MSHDVESMMYVGATPWHDLGVKLESAPTTAQAIAAAGLDWTVGLRPLVTAGDPSTSYAGAESVGHKASYRMTDGAILGVVGPTWRPLQNADAFAFFDPFLATGEASLETAGSLRNGRRVWILAALNRDPSVIVAKSDDTVRKYVLLSNSHDGTLAIKVGFTPIRVVCSNTLAMAHNDSSSTLLRVRHTKNSVATLDLVRDAMNLANASFEATADMYRTLARTDIVEADLKRYVNMVFSPNKRAQSTGMVLANAPTIIEAEFEPEAEDKRTVYPKIKTLFETGRGNQLPGVRGTYWAAYNAITEYLAYERGTDAGTRLNEAWFGTGAVLNRRALQVGVQMANA